jgi:hypothetical protein
LAATFSLKAFTEILAIGIVKAFGDRKFIRFSSFLTIGGEGEGRYYEFMTQHPELTGAMAAYWRFMNGPATVDEKKQYALSIGEGWSRGASYKFRTPLDCIEITCDGINKSVSIDSFDSFPLSLLDYPQQGRTTSEIVQFICAASTNVVMHIDYNRDVLSNPALLKLMRMLMDRKFDPGRLMVNVEDSEEWDFVYNV